ncbi:thioredoxin family protein [bacterium]|nr:thioredoxin family protein [bacterium]
MTVRSLLVVGLLFAAPAAALDLGATAPKADVKMRSVDGPAVSIAEIAGTKGTLVIFTCNHCPWAKAWEQRIATLGNTYGKRGIGVIAINANDPAAYADDSYDGMVARARALGLQFPYVVDSGSTVARAFAAERTPEAFLFDAQGRLVYHGTIDDNAEHADQVKEAYLANALEAVASGQPVAVKETKALGCTIKYYGS